MDDLEEKFKRAASHLELVAPELSAEDLLEFYGLYKQATVGPCTIPKPSWYQAQAKQKWEAWKRLGDMNTEDAMNGYIEKLTSVYPSWEECSAIETRGWVAISTFTNTDEEIKDAEKTFFDWIKEGNEELVQQMINTDPKLVFTMDETELLPVHWAADRGYLPILKCLVKSGADISARDGEGQTPLHYAASCGHFHAVRYLIANGAPSMEDDNGVRPLDIAAPNVRSAVAEAFII